MLYALEQLLINAIDPAFPNNVDVNGGPWRDNDGVAVQVHARSLRLEPVEDEPAEDGPGHLLTIQDWVASGSSLDFAIPPAVTGEVIEVEAPPGFPARRGDDFFLDDRTIRFYRAPAAGNPGVRARIVGDPAKGYRRQRPCRIEIEIGAFDNDVDDVDDRLETALHVALAELVDLPILAADVVGGANVWMRVARARTSLEWIERTLAPDRPNWFRAAALIVLEGELDLLVAKGAPEPTSIIESIHGSVTENDDTADFIVDGQPSAPPVAPRAIEGEPTSLVRGVSNAAATELAGLTPPVDTIAELAALDFEAVFDDLSDPDMTRADRHKAQMILRFPSLPSLPAAALVPTLADLLALTLDDFAALIEYELAYAITLRDELLTLDLLLKGSAMSSLTLGEFA